MTRNYKIKGSISRDGIHPTQQRRDTASWHGNIMIQFALFMQER